MDSMAIQRTIGTAYPAAIFFFLAAWNAAGQGAGPKVRPPSGRKLASIKEDSL